MREVNLTKEVYGRSTYLVTDTEQAYIDEINSLRQQLLEANTSFLNINNVI